MMNDHVFDCEAMEAELLGQDSDDVPADAVDRNPSTRTVLGSRLFEVFCERIIVSFDPLDFSVGKVNDANVACGLQV